MMIAQRRPPCVIACALQWAGVARNILALNVLPARGNLQRFRRVRKIGVELRRHPMAVYKVCGPFRSVHDDKPGSFAVL